ncbi:MAG TPA: hypothetical protein VLC93_19710, partial [Myxococcota bacterium]|nr:hypothetical protein [Myxococcota bacterium]
MKYASTVVALLLSSSSVARAYTVTVTDFTDDVAAGPPCSVREALDEVSAVANGCVLEGIAEEPYVVVLPAGPYLIDGGTLTVSNKELRGAGSGRSVLRLGLDNSWLITIAGTSTLRGMTLLWTGEGVLASAVIATGASAQGLLTDVDIRGFQLTSNSAANGGGSAITAASGATVTMRGGRIVGCHGHGWAAVAFSNGHVAIEDTVFEGNRTQRGVVAGIGGTSRVDVTRSVFRDGVHDFNTYAAVYGNVGVRDSLFANNL